jgi:hypothetical protein
MEASLSRRRKTNEARANAVPTVSLATAMFVLLLVLLALHLSLSSVFDTSHLRAFQFALYILLVFFR